MDPFTILYLINGIILILIVGLYIEIERINHNVKK